MQVPEVSRITEGATLSTMQMEDAGDFEMAKTEASRRAETYQ